MTEPMVSVVIPTLGRWELLRTTLGTVLAQENVALEVILVDGSADGAGRTFADTLGDPRVRVRRMPGSGIAAKRNAGVAEARGTWIAFLDDDDLWAPTKLAGQIGDAGDAEFVFSGCVVVDECCHERTVLLPPSDEHALYSNLLGANVVPAGASNVVVRTEAIRGVGDFDEDLSILDDWDMWIRLAREVRAHSSPDIVVAHREHSGSEGARRPEDALAEAERLMDKHGARETLDRERLLRWAIGAHRRAGRRGAAARGYLEVARRYRRPRDLARAGGILLGERAMRLGQTGVRPTASAPWLAEVRHRCPGNVRRLDSVP